MDRLLDGDPEASFSFLVQEHLRGVARAALKDLSATHKGLMGRAKVLAGDLTLPWLGLGKRT